MSDDIQAIDRRLCETAPEQSQLDFYAGAYEMARLLLTSQREVLEDQVRICKERLETCGVAFTDTENPHEHD